MIDRTFRTAIYSMLLLGLFVVSMDGCTGRRHQDRFKWAEFINNAIEYKTEHKSNPVYFDVRRIMPFGWEKFYVFPPYTTVETIENALGFRWRTAKKTGIGDRDDIALLVFVTGQTVQEYIEQPRNKGDFSRLKPAYAYSPREAYFELVAEDDNGREVLVFVDSDRPE